MQPQGLYSLKNYNLTTPILQRAQAITQYRFRLFPVRSPLQRESLRFLFLALLRCFSSRGSPPCPIYSDKDTSGLPKVSFLIRKSSDLSLIDSSPKLMAAFRLLHRLLMPQASTKCPFQLTTNFADYSNIEHSLIHIFQRSQIFYITICAFFKRIIYTRKVKKKQQSKFLVEMSGFEPLTYRVQNGRSAN